MKININQLETILGKGIFLIKSVYEEYSYKISTQESALDAEKLLHQKSRISPLFFILFSNIFSGVCMFDKWRIDIQKTWSEPMSIYCSLGNKGNEPSCHFLFELQTPK